jgi:hypothetical protein
MVPDEGIEPPTFGLQNQTNRLSYSPQSEESVVIVGFPGDAIDAHSAYGAD